MSRSSEAQNPCIDAAIIGGGIAGAWLYHLLTRRGYNVILLEAETLGAGQTLASQGMIHGGLKYALTGTITRASEAIASMPSRWRTCLEQADADVDLASLDVVADTYYMFARNSAYGKLTSFFASRALRGRIERIKDVQSLPEFAGFDGVVYALRDFVIDPEDLLGKLVAINPDRVFQLRAGPENVRRLADGQYQLDLLDQQLNARYLISCAGNGSSELLTQLQIPNIAVQQRPLKQVIVRPAAHQVKLFAHCITGVTSSEPRLTITSHASSNGLIWYLGGLLASEGVHLSDEEQCARAAAELTTCVPWLDWRGASYEALSVNRAEPRQTSGSRPDEAYAAKQDNFIQCFPTKLTLAPDLGDRVLALLEPPRSSTAWQSNHPRAAVGQAPW
ncbi:MAG: FAD-dependent oxidoreductase [Pseudomonadota bacterium]